MQQIKLFRGLESELPGLENQVNKWLAESGGKVVQVFGNIAPQSHATDPKGSSVSAGPYVHSDIFLAVLYEKP